uniref:Uncharacterized protein n=1 Tax=Nelumbo nucifera TaxID=4432 RepID=A0A822Z046_NELNU|nr:TPA_asm: hypothetical protein HUJ06_007496 [Nelumbo nucifera]
MRQKRESLSDNHATISAIRSEMTENDPLLPGQPKS